MSELTKFRKEKDGFFKSHPASPLTPEQQTSFKRLKYYPENPSLHFEVEVAEHPTKERMQMVASDGSLQLYQRYGQFRFQAAGKTCTLQVYRNPDGGHYFLPFKDATSGKETYENGRYLEIEPLPDGKFLVDFNYAYSPYCAYNEYWVCPIPPAENTLQIPIEAGEKKISN